MTADLNALPFIAANADGTRSFWSVTPSGDYAADCATGRDFAGQALAHIAAAGFPPLLGHIVKAMRSSDWTGIETGFCQALAEGSSV